MEHSKAVTDAWTRHRQWSLAADAARARVERRRRVVLALLVIGAVAGAAATQTSWPRSVTGTAAGLASFVLAVAALVRLQYLGVDEVGRWPTARTASEALKAQVIRYLAGVAPFDGSDADRQLNDQVELVQDRAARNSRGLIDFLAQQPDGRALPAIHDFESYRAERAQRQADWHRGKIGEHLHRATLIGRAEVASSVVGAVLAAVAAGTGTTGLAGWVGVASTVAATLAAHRAAANHERIAAGYGVTADVLDRLMTRLPESPDAVQQAAFINEVEARLAAQNGTWVELFPTS